jgi:hypothetical protein
MATGRRGAAFVAWKSEVHAECRKRGLDVRAIFYGMKARDVPAAYEAGLPPAAFAALLCP